MFVFAGFLALQLHRHALNFSLSPLPSAPHRNDLPVSGVCSFRMADVKKALQGEFYRTGDEHLRKYHEFDVPFWKNEQHPGRCEITSKTDKNVTSAIQKRHALMADQVGHSLSEIHQTAPRLQT